MLTKRWLILVAIFLLGMTTNSLSVWGQSVAQNTHFQGGNWLDKWLSGPLPGQPQQSTTSNQEAIVSPPAEVSDRSYITLHRKSQETAQRSSSPYQPQDIVGKPEQQETPKRLSILEDMREPDETSSRFYVGGGLGYSQIDTGIDNLTGSAELDDADLSYKVFAGFKFDKYSSVELFYINFGEASLSGQTGDTFQLDGATATFNQNATVDVSADAIGVTGVASLPLTDRISPFLKAGLFYFETEADIAGSVTSVTLSDDGFNGQLGIGVDYLLSRRLGVRAEYERYGVLEGDVIDVFSLSGSYHF